MKFRKIVLFFSVILIACLTYIVLYHTTNIVMVNEKKGIVIPNIEEIKEKLLEDSNGMTYYISATGTSSIGTNIEDPMSLEVALNKTYHDNDKILFKAGDVFYGVISFNTEMTDNNFIYVGSYGEGDKPIISGARILDNENAWENNDGIYKLDLSNEKNFYGFRGYEKNSYNIGFFADDNGNIYGARKRRKDLMISEFDFYCEDNFIYVKCSENPSKKLGKVKFVSRYNLFCVSSNMIVENLNIQYTGAHGIVNKTFDVNNAYIQEDRKSTRLNSSH